ncbi:hypothetical protein [Candidatus Cytomitobacter primus]|uniref:Uncharacterized protein n=1 Tax=Candidatus Cytomitobacter primus TaxID=2066024 RepID=A0A5C0UFF0_9PROT|nr:hypothetical protein [Candidatus Cytomitobacter primus]QEK38788.1 hypothetical protein FZC34_02645 [Candidatus Cytomitobacter primus]
MKNLKILSLLLCLSVMANGPELTECTSKFAYCLKSPGRATEVAVPNMGAQVLTDAVYKKRYDIVKGAIPSIDEEKCKYLVYTMIINRKSKPEYVKKIGENTVEQLFAGLSNADKSYAMLRYVYESRPYIMKQSARYAELADAYGNYDMDGDVFKNAMYLAERSQNGTLEVDWDLESDRLEAHSLYYNSIYEYNLENPGLSMISDKAEAAKVNATILQSLSKDKEHFTNIAKHIALKKMAVEAAKGLEKFKIMLDEVVRQDASWNMVHIVQMNKAAQKHFKDTQLYLDDLVGVEITMSDLRSIKNVQGGYVVIFGDKDKVKFDEIIELFNTDREKCKELIWERIVAGEEYINKYIVKPMFDKLFNEMEKMDKEVLQEVINRSRKEKVWGEVGNRGGGKKFRAYYPGEERRGDVEFFKKDYADWYAKSDGDKAVTALRKEEAAKLAKERDHEDYIVHLFDRAEELLNGYEGDKDVMGEIFGNFLFLRWAEYKENARGRDFMNSAKDALEGMLKLESSDIEKLNAISNEKIKSLQ